MQAQQASEADIKAVSAGANFSVQTLLPTLIRIDLTGTARNFPIPYYVIQGRNDLNTPTETAAAYFATIQAPKKEMLGH